MGVLEHDVDDPVPTARIDADAVQWRDAEGGRGGSPLLIMMHGYGSNERDLLSLAPLLPRNLTIASLRAPHSLVPPGIIAGPEVASGLVAPVLPDAYAWFDIMSLQPNLEISRTQVDASTRAVLDWLDALPEGSTGDFSSIGLLGFSQGGTMALQLARTAPERFSYVVQLSGFVHPAAYSDDDSHPGDATLAERSPRMPAFQAWGSADPVIPEERTRATRAWMADHFDVEAHEYPMPHAVHPDEVRDIAAFLHRVTGG